MIKNYTPRLYHVYARIRQHYTLDRSAGQSLVITGIYCLKPGYKQCEQSLKLVATECSALADLACFSNRLRGKRFKQTSYEGKKKTRP